MSTGEGSDAAAYPSGRPIAVGDRVWWDEGAAIGYVRECWSRPEEHRRVGLTEPSLLITQASDPRCPSTPIAYPLRALGDEGVDVLTSAEASEVDAVLAAVARHLVASTTSDLGVACVCEAGRLLHWIVTRYSATSCVSYRVPPTLTGIDVLPG